MRKAGGVAFRKAIFAKAADLVEAALGKFRVVAALDHATDHLVLQFVDHPARTERGHRLAQLIGLDAGKLGRIERDLHRLFLKDRDAERALQNGGKLIGGPMFRRGFGNDDLLVAPAALEIGMNHIALDRPRPHDGDFDHQIVELARLEARQHVHLRAAFHLEHAQTVAFYQHVIHPRILPRRGRQRQIAAMMGAQQIEAFLQTGQHPQRQHVDLEDTERVDIVLVPFDEAAIGHRAIADRHGFRQRPLRQDKAADMLRQMPRHADYLLGQPEHPAQLRIGHVEPRFLRVLFSDLPAVTAPDCPRERGGGVFRQAHHLAHFADRHARAIVDHGGA